MLGQRQAVGAGDGDAQALEGADGELLDGVAAGDQDQHVAGADRARAVLAVDQLAMGEPGLDLGGDAVGDAALRLVGAAGLVGEGPGLGLGRGLVVGGERPELDQARGVGTVGVVADGLAGPDHAHQLGPGQDAIHAFEHGPGRAEGEVEGLLGEGQRCRGGKAPELVADAAEVLEVGTLEAVDRLLLVADDEEGAGAGVGAQAGQELLRQALDDLPLGGAGVLGLVDQDVVQALVELEEDPFLAAGGGEQAAGVLDQVVEVERASRGASAPRTR